MIPYAPSMFPDSVTVLTPTFGTDADGALTPSLGAGSSVPASVQRMSEFERREAQQAFGGVLGHEVYNVLFGANPSVPTADVPIDWTADAAGAFTSPIRLASLGPAEAPGGLMSRWTVRAARKG